jgi:hypothetical protein
VLLGLSEPIHAYVHALYLLLREDENMDVDQQDLKKGVYTWQMQGMK